MAKPPPGTILWHDLTVNDASGMRDFYAAVVGWEPSAVDMGDYEDFTLRPKGGEGVAAICNARGGSADMPKSWLCYVVVASLQDSLATVNALGGDVIVQPQRLGKGKFAVIKDPQGGVIALYQV